MSEEAAVVSGFVDFWTHLIQNNWSLVLGLLVAFILYRFAKASANLVLGLIFTAVAISMLTNMFPQEQARLMFSSKDLRR